MTLNTFLMPLVVQVTLDIGIIEKIKWVNICFFIFEEVIGIFHLKHVFQ